MFDAGGNRRKDSNLIKGIMGDLQRTFSIIKPDAVAAGNARKILAHLEGAGFRIVGLRLLKMSQEEAEGFYAVHKERPFFGGLVKFMTEGPVVIMALEREDAIRKLREVMGATNPANAAEGTIRKLYRGEHRAECGPRVGRAGDGGGGTGLFLPHN